MEPTVAIESGADSTPVVHPIIDAYHQQLLSGPLVEAPLRASSAAVVSTFSSLVEAHKSEVEVLQLDNTHLRQQLEKCAQVIESLSTKLQEQQQTLSVAEAKPKLASDVLSASPEQEATQTESTTTADTFGTVPGCSGSSLEVSALTAVAPTAAAQCSPEAVAALLTEVASARSYVRQADVVQQQWMQSASSLSTLIGNLTRENASFRKEVELLKSSTVDRELHQKVLVELDAARQQLETMVLEGEQMAIEFDHKSQQQNDVVVQLRSDLERMSARAEATHPSQSEGHSGPTPHHHGELWQVAMRELEEQAIVAASAQDTKAKLHEVEAALSKSLQHTEDLRTELNSITADNERLRSDAQNLTFRNSVLSQQLSSLLVKCEKLARIVRGNNADIDSQVSTTSVQPLDHPRANSSALFLATEATRLLSRRSSASVQQRPTSSYPLATTDITLTPGEARHAPSRSRLSNSYACLSTRRLDVVALDESGIAPSEAQRLQTTPALEVERGLQRSLGTFHSARRRSVAMRNFGSAELSVALPTEARLPASDQLSGVSLGRPSSFSILDPQQRTLYQSPHQPPLNATDKLGNSTSASPTSDSAMEWLELLDQIDANEDIDRYSVNSVSELVVRNQELLQQLYSATQSSSPLAAVASSSNDHVEEAARPRASLSGQKRPRSPSNNSAEVKDKDKHTAPFAPTPLPTISPLLPSGSAGETLTTASFATVPSGNNPQLQSSVDDMSADAQGIAQKLFQAVLDRQAAQQHVSQENIITLLLSVMEAQQQFHQQVEKGVDGGASTRDVLSGSLIGSLVNLCCSQAMKLANQSTSEAERITQLQHPWWEAARGMVEELVREVTALLTSAAPTTAVVETATSSDSKATSNAEGEMLRHLLHLLQHASLKEGTLLQVFQVALKRQGSYMALIQRRERKKRRLATASTSPPPVVPTSLQPVHDTNEEAADTQPEQNLTLSARLRPVAPPGRLSPYGSPVVVHATADEFPASSMPQTEILPPIASSYALDGGSSDEDDVDDVWLCNNDDHSGRLDELREQLALLSAKFHAQTNELNEERSQHVKLLEQMWKLEAEREDAMAVLDASEQKMASMMTREEYESVVSELDRGRSTISDLEGQLEFAHRQKMATQAENEALAKELDGHQKRFEEKSIDLRRDLQQATDALESEHARYRRLQHDLSDAKMEIDAVRRNAHIVQEDLLASKESNHGLQQEVDELKVALLSADSSQELLRRLYPGDTALSANADLIQRMQAKIQRLENELSMIRKESERLTQSITSKDHQLRQEVQRRQSAEAHLQSSLEQLTSSQVAWRSAPMEGSTALESTEQDMPTPHVVRDLMRTVEQLETSVAGYRSEIHVLRESEAAWKKREEELRAEVQLLSRNPISDCARRYGLQDTTSFEKQLEELDARCQALQTKQIDCEAALASAQKKLEVSEDALQRSEQDLKELESQLRAANDECQELTNSVESQAQSIRTLEAEKVEVANALATSEEAGRVAQEHLHSVEAAKSKLQEDYRKCEEDRRTIFTNMNAVMDKVKDLERDLQRSDAEKRAANEALAQGISTVSRRHQAPPPRYGGTSLSLTSAFGSATPSSQSPSPNTSTR